MSNPLKGHATARREQLLADALHLCNQAERAAGRGDLISAGQLILQSLECERRAGAAGPQVLQLIKPRH